jgi:hypothetical protein
MVCKHLALAPLEKALMASGATVTSRGAAWSRNCREWVYFDVRLDIAAIRERFVFADCVRMHENLDCKSGTERGFECTACHDAVMGLVSGGPVFP